MLCFGQHSRRLDADARRMPWLQDAARLRDALAALLPPPPPPPPPVPLVACTSVAITHGVRVTVRSEYMREHSDSSQGAHAFAYYVTLSNEGTAPVRLMSRHWVITDAQGRTEHVRGPGVIGVQPRLAPGESYSYSSFCPLRTPSGTMHGSFAFVIDAPGADEPPARFAVRVARFGLDVKGQDVRMPPDGGAEMAYDTDADATQA
jgi:ApaG protein